MAKKEVKSKGRDTMDLLLENSITLQKTLASLAVELKGLNKKVSSLLKLFEDASKAFKEAKVKGMAAPAEAAVPEELMEKIDELVKQNKTIARGLILLERTVRENMASRTAKPGSGPAREEYKPKPLPEFTF